MLKNIVKKYLGIHRIKYIKSFFINSIEKNENINRIIFYSQFITSGNLCFDVGANYGTITKSLLELGAKVVAVEPQAECYKFLHMKFGGRIFLEKIALGEKDDLKEMFISDKTNLISSLSEDWINAVKKSGRFKDHTWGKKVIVPITTLDKLLCKYGTPHYIKIDVEGYEYEVMKGLTHQINYISFEFTLPEQIEKTILCLDYLTDLYENLECNYALETNKKMEWCLNEWVNVSEFKGIISSFKIPHYGDVFIHLKR